MSEPTDTPVADTAEQGPSIGRQVDDLVAETKDLRKREAALSAEFADVAKTLRRRLAALADLIGRPAAAKLLEVTPRELAGMLRGTRTDG